MEPKLTQNRLKLTRIHPQLILQSLKRFGDHKFSSFILKLAKDFYQASYLVENLMEPKLTQNRLKLTRIHPQLVLQSLKSQNLNKPRKIPKNTSSEIMQHVHFQKSSVTKTAVMWQFHNKNWLFPLSSKYI